MKTHFQVTNIMIEQTPKPNYGILAMYLSEFLSEIFFKILFSRIPFTTFIFGIFPLFWSEYFREAENGDWNSAHKSSRLCLLYHVMLVFSLGSTISRIVFIYYHNTVEDGQKIPVTKWVNWTKSGQIWAKSGQKSQF